MDAERERLKQDLRGLLSGDVLVDDATLELYAGDASLFQIRPTAVVRPRTLDDVVSCVKYAAERHLPIHARGAGSGLTGGALGPGLVVDFSTHFRRVIEIGPDFVRVQPGVVLERLNDRLAAEGRQFGPDPSTAAVTTLGGVVGVDSSGSRRLRYGSARDHVRGIQAVLADGAVVDFGREKLAPPTGAVVDPRKSDLVERLVGTIDAAGPALQKHVPRSSANCAGYHLFHCRRPDSLDLANLLTGSEGTLALFTELTLATSPLPRHRGVALLFFERMEWAARAVPDVTGAGASACDLLDRRLLGVAREESTEFADLIPATAEACLLVEHEGDDGPEVHERVRLLVDRIRRRRRLAFDSRQAFSAPEVARFWNLVRRVVPRLHRLKGATRPVPFIEDAAIPPAALARFLTALQNLLKKHQVFASLYGHAGHGQLHLRPFLDLHRPDHRALMPVLAADVYALVIESGGAVSGEHGDGLSRTPFLRRQYGDLYPVFKEIKRHFDPHNIFNPGKIVSDDESTFLKYLRPIGHRLATEADPRPAPPTDAVVPVDPTMPSSDGDSSPSPTDATPAPPGPLVQLQLAWTPAELADAALACNGCGACRTQGAEARMCPIFRFAPREEASPRAKANLMQAVVTGRLPLASLRSEEAKAVADLCVNCQQCRLECPAGVDIPRLMIEAKAAYVDAHGLRSNDWALAQLDWLGSFGVTLAPLLNRLLVNPWGRWLLERTIGLAQQRKVPAFAGRTFLARAARRRLTRPSRRSGPKVAYFVDTYANYFDANLGEALTAVFEHNGVAVYVPPEQRQSGMSMISVGALDQARQVARRNVAVLAEAVRQGYHVVASEPSAALALRREYPLLLDDDDARLVAANTSEACAYLWRLHLAGRLQLDFRPLPVQLGYHQPCHVRALEQGAPAEDLLRLVAGLAVERAEQGCSGMAGLFGLKRENYRNSLRAGWPLISAVRDASWLAGATECSSCKMQMEQGSTKPVLHPLKLLALAYGLMPELTAQLHRRGRALRVT